MDNHPQRPPLKLSLTNFQAEVYEWVIQCFGKEIADDLVERNQRFFEEATELVQSLGYTREAAHRMVDYVYDRDVGDPKQEVGGVMVTLAALCQPNGIRMMTSAFDELDRIWEKIPVIREKQKQKPPHFGEPSVSDHLYGRVTLIPEWNPTNAQKAFIMGTFGTPEQQEEARKFFAYWLNINSQMSTKFHVVKDNHASSEPGQTSAT